MPPVITRFAPSPTGHLHVGGARTALFCWAYARRHGGRFILRIEDTDQKRSSEDAARGILEDLAWLGIHWDEGPTWAPPHSAAAGVPRHSAAELDASPIGGDPRHVGPFFQARRLDVYNRHLEALIERDLAYPAFDTAEELDALRREAAARKATFRYRRAPDYDRDACLRRYMAGEACVVRFRMPDEPVRVTDAVLGEIDFTEEHLDDFVLRKADGFPTYHFAVVVDDELMGVTHVLRGQEHLNNTPRHVALQRALGFRTPVYAHMPLIFNPDGSKMSKRDKDKHVRQECLFQRNWAKAVYFMLSRSVSMTEDEDYKLQLEVDDLFMAGTHVELKQINAEELAASVTADPATRASLIAATRSLIEWFRDKTRQLPTDALLALARELNLSLPEIDVEDFRRSGYLPETLCNYLALLGWNPGLKNPDGTDLERFDMAFLAEHFSLDRIGRSNAKFDRDKLLAFNQAAIAALAPAEFDRRWREWCDRYDPDLPAILGDRFALAAHAVQPRIRTLGQCREPIAFALISDDAVEFDEKAVEKTLRKGDPRGLDVLRDFLPALVSLADFTPDAIDAAAKAFCERRSLGMGKLAQPLRVAVSGSTVSPGLGETLGLIGR
ncbi:MAG TPA: glutamate--tRNA ligase, partial [Phycisphaerales bacterium]|nr:glutamate--tRNA ligase [Phycisphaerales bacterium]